MENKIVALAEFLEVEAQEIKVSNWSENVFHYGSQEYLVCTDEEATDEFREYQQNLIDDMGILSFTEWAQEFILDNFADEDWFNEAMKESFESYCEDIRGETAEDTEKFETRLDEELYDNDCITVEDYVEMMCEGWNSGIEYYVSNFGQDSFQQAVKENDLIDWDSVIEWLEREDGRECLATYDGVENEHDEYYIYRTN